MTTLETHAIERSTYAIPIAFLDDAGSAVTPDSATWTLTDKAGNIVNSRSAVAITPATTATIVLSGADLALPSTLFGNERVVTVEWVYDSSLGNNLPGKQEIRFVIDELVGVS